LPQTTFLVTSRSALRLRGEHEFPVPPLGLPSSSAIRPDDIDRWPATALFWERARAVRPGLHLDALAVAEICRKLDGLPLLDIVREYAAARFADAGEIGEVERRHALHYLALAERAEPHLAGSAHRGVVHAPRRRPRQPPAGHGVDHRQR
jgi:predicted ATPase